MRVEAPLDGGPVSRVRSAEAMGVDRRARAAGLLLGIGLGGFVDGIALHQIAHWHNMLSARIPPDSMAAMQANMRADGWFHAGTWAITVAGVFLLWSAGRSTVPLPPVRFLVGLLFTGWGAFNLVEGIVDHHLLGLHHVRDLPAHVPAYDWAFLLIGGGGFVALGWLLTRRAPRSVPH
ncbi:MAG TPA: DUF2243 domain-containing protein [Longimicrobium sp.]|nr:DUF2243 domain-containing protein [Longimicrobium sp.]